MKEGRFHGHDYRVDKIVSALEATIQYPDQYFIAYDSEFRGLALMAISEHYFSSYKWVCDLAFFVKPEARGGLLACRLLKAVEKWGRSQGAHEVTILHNTGIDDGSTKFFNGLGYQTKGHIFSKEI